MRTVKAEENHSARTDLPPQQPRHEILQPNSSLKQVPLPCKPDSVHSTFAELYGHLSYPTEVGHLPCGMVRLIPGDPDRAGTLPLLCLAPRGVYRASSVTLGAVGSYPTFSPLPQRTGAVCFLLHFPSGWLEPSVPCYSQGAPPYGVRTFLDPTSKLMKPRPSGERRAHPKPKV
jgi:hypothetical protein